MLKQRERFFVNLFVLSDLLLSVATFVAAYFIRELLIDKALTYSNEYVLLVVIMTPVWFFLLKFTDLTSYQRTKSYAIIFLEYSLMIGIGTLVLFLFIFTLKMDTISRPVVYIFAISNMLVLFSFKVLIYELIKHRRIKVFRPLNVFIYVDDQGRYFLDKIDKNSEWEICIKGIFTDSEEVVKAYGGKLRIFSLDEDLGDLLDKEDIDQVMYCVSGEAHKSVIPLVYICQQVGVAFSLISDLVGLLISKAHVDYLGETAYITIMKTSSDRIALQIKYAFEFLFSLFILLLGLPFWLVIGLLIKIDSKGPVFFKQLRVGLNGRCFYVYKFRTMVQNAEELKTQLEMRNEVDGPVFKIKKDPRITRIGRFLRKTSIDEVPQFINVLRGEMSIVGPRPPLPKEVDQYERWQRRRLSMRPGITCLWQVSGRNALSFEKWMKLDLRYIDNWSLKLDLIILLKTIRTVLKADGH